MVAIAGMRIYLNFDLDESYTPTLIRFAAGTGYHDLQEFSVMRFERPTGWIDVDWEGVGDAELEVVDGELSVLRCMLVQVRICENHQNGKDTHLRGLQIFSRDNTSRSNERTEMVKLTNAIQNDIADNRRKSIEIWDLGGWMDAPVLR
jgi:anaphase-promoting complex subunit 10